MQLVHSEKKINHYRMVTINLFPKGKWLIFTHVIAACTSSICCCTRFSLMLAFAFSDFKWPIVSQAKYQYICHNTYSKYLNHYFYYKF